METAVRWVRRDVFDFGLAYVSAVFAGAGACGVMFGLSMAASSSELISGLATGLTVVFFSTPVWLFGVAIIGLPLAVLVDRIWRLGPLSATLIGAVTSGSAWFGIIYGFTGSEQTSVLPLVAGAMVGGVAGLLGWCGGALSLERAA